MTERIAVLGAGEMGETLVRAILASGHPRDQITISARRGDRASELRSAYGVEVTENVNAVADAQVVLIAVKPGNVVDLLREIRSHLCPDATVVSLAAGVNLSTLESSLEPGTAVVRAMPNTPASVGVGMFGVSAGSSCDSQQLAGVVKLLSAGGKVLVVDETDQDALTAVSGSGPAYLFYLAEAMVAGGIRVGLREEIARALTTQTLLGAAALLDSSAESATELRRRITSTGGTTAAAIDTFDAAGVMEALVAGVEAARDRSKALSEA